MNIFICSIHHFDPQFLIHKSSLTHLVPKIQSDIQKIPLNIAPNAKFPLFDQYFLQNRAPRERQHIYFTELVISLVLRPTKLEPLAIGHVASCRLAI